ncbi:MAG TPA: hypothetical protein VGI99_11315 [Gemmataceae bacterium]|jgi:hypothetical protein
MLRTAWCCTRDFFLIVAGGYLGAFLGLGFGALVGWMFPEVIEMIWKPEPLEAFNVEIGAGMGMIAGIPIGATGMAAARFINAIRERGPAKRCIDQ